MQKIKLKKEPKLDAKCDSYNYQQEALKQICNLDYAAIFHEQGLGKSKIALDLILYWLENKLTDTVLLIVKKNLLYNWEKEIQLHTHLKPRILSQNKKSNFYVYNSPARLVLMHYEVAIADKDRLELFLQTRSVSAILDESSKIKNPQSKLTQIFFELSEYFIKRIIITGTPIANRPYDIWSQIWFLDNGKSLGNSFEDFKKNNNLDNYLYKDEDKQKLLKQNLEEIYPKISWFSVRETKESGIIPLPKKNFIDINVDWELKQKDLYDQTAYDLRTTIISNGIPVEDCSEDILKRLLRLVQICSNPRLIDESYTTYPGKFEMLEEIINEKLKQNEKIIVWTNFTDNVEFLSQFLQGYELVKISGRYTLQKRNEEIDNFIYDSNYKILIATPAIAKEGLTLTAANNAIFFDRSFSLDNYLQAQDRIHRISQTKDCNIYKLIMKDSIDEWVDKLLQAKEIAAKYSTQDISEHQYENTMNFDYGKMIHDILNI